MATAGPSRLPQCHHQLITTTSDRIREIAQPDEPVSLHQNAFPSRESLSLHQQFFPTPSLKTIFTPDLVKQILVHGAQCAECENHLRKRPEVKPNAKDVERILKTDASLNLFALLVFLGYPLLIGCFLSTYAEGAIPSPRFVTRYALSDRPFKHLPAKQMQFLTAEFEDAKWRFSVPDFDQEGTFQNYPDRTLMPYLSQDRIDEGAYGIVYKVTIHPGYCSDKFLESVKRGPRSSSRSTGVVFARKEFKSREVVDFLKERTALELIDKLNHPHLIHIKQTYQLGERFNILFPYAKANLQDYLRKEQAPRNRQVSKNPMWEQVLGITEALSKMINFQDPDDNRGLKGYHLDLKPQNVLVFIERAPGRPSKEVFRISDFGQSEFIDVGNSGTTSTLIGANGTDAYAPPEYYGIGASPVYDVWSLGIIVLEILAFAIRGTDGLIHESTGLDKARETKGSEYHNSRFFSGRGQSALVKQEILTWLDDLVEDLVLQDVEREQFVKPLVKLIREMLNPNYENRRTIGEVLSRMRVIFKAGISDPSEETALSLKKKDENILVDLKSVQLYPDGLQGYSAQSNFFVFEDRAASLRIVAKDHILNARHQRRELRVIPLFQYTDEVELDHFPFAFESAVDEGTKNSLSGVTIVVDNEKFSRHLQAALINHEVSERFKVTRLSIKTHVPLMKKAKTRISKLVAEPSSLFSKSSNTNSDSSADVEEEAFWMELWVEKQMRTFDLKALNALSETSGQPRLNREAALEKSIPLGRVVIYCKDRVVIIPFARESAIANRADGETSHSISFQPMDAKRTEAFKVSCLKCHRKGTSLGIPMSFETLSEMEERNAFLCKLLEVNFARHQDASKFYLLFRRQKSRWQALIRGDSTQIPKLYTLQSDSEYGLNIIGEAKGIDLVPQKDADIKSIKSTHVVDISDVQSLKSVTTFRDSGFGSSNQSGSGVTGIDETALNQILRILLSDTALQSMFVEAAQKVDKEKYIRNIRRLVRLYYQDLRRDAVDLSQKNAANTLGQHAIWCARELYNLAHPEETPDIQSFTASLPQQVEKNELLEQYIRSTAQPPIAHHAPPPTPEKDEADNDDSNSDQSDTSEVEYAEFPNIEHIRRFLVGGVAYTQLKSNLNGFINPRVIDKVTFEDQNHTESPNSGSRSEPELGLQSLQNEQGFPPRSQISSYPPGLFEDLDDTNPLESHQYPYASESDTETIDSSSVEEPKSTFGKMRNKALQGEIHNPPTPFEKASRTFMGGLRLYYDSLSTLKVEIYENSNLNILAKSSEALHDDSGLSLGLPTHLSEERRKNGRSIFPEIDFAMLSSALPELIDQSPEAGPSLARDLLSVIECREVLFVVCANLFRLQESNFIGPGITIPIADTRRPNVINHVTVSVAQVRGLAGYFNFGIADIISARRAENLRSILEVAMQKCEEFLLRLGLSSSNGEGNITSCYAAVCLLDFAVLVHVSAQIEDIETDPTNERSTFEIPTGMAPNLSARIKLQRFKTSCLDQFLNYQEVWVFYANNCSVIPPLYMSMSIAEFADIWGPVWEIRDDQENTVQYDTGNGCIIPWQHDPAAHPELSQQEQLCHWVAKNTTPGALPLDGSDSHAVPTPDISPPPFTNKVKLLIGAPPRGRRHMKWSSCKCDIPTIEARLLGSNRLSPLGANDSYSYIDSRGASLVGGKYLSAGATISIKREDGVRSKEFFLNSWEKQPEFRDLRDFSKLWGVAVSLCTINAERVSLFELLCTPTVKRYLKRVQWKDQAVELAFLKTIGEEGSLDALCQLWDQGRNEELGKVLFGCLQALSLTGYDEKRDQFSAFWISPDSTLPQRIILEPGEHSWTKFLKDSKNSFAVAVMVEDCLGARFARRRCGAQKGGSALQTSICVNDEIDPSQKLVRVPLTVLQTDRQRWAWEWDVSNLSKGICFPVRSEGRLKTIKRLDTRQLLLEWDLVWREVLKGYAGMQRGKANGHWEYTGILEGRGQPIPVFLLSPES